MRKTLRGLLLLLCVAANVTAQQAAAADDIPANWCRSELFPSDTAEFKVATIGGNWTARINFFGDADDCPKYEVRCETKSYLITGDKVLVSRTYGPWICGWYQTPKGYEIVGWLLADKLLLPPPPAPPPLENWIGLWKYARKSLNIRREGKSASLKVEGSAIWEGGGANVRLGGIEAVGQPQGHEIILMQDGCQVTLKLVGDYLIASDNSGCGGVNVRLNGVFRKARRGKRK